MKQFLACVVIALALLVAYQAYRHQLELAEKDALAKAREEAIEEAARKPEPKATPPPSTPAPRRLLVSRSLEPHVVKLLSPVGVKEDREDMVPLLSITRERLLDMKVHSSAVEHPVLNAAVGATEALIAVAEERTKAIQSALEASFGAKGTLDSPNTATSGSAFFAQAAAKRWDEQRTRAKGSIDQSMARLRQMERELNAGIPPDAVNLTYEEPELPAIVVQVDETAAGKNPLERGSYNHRSQVSRRAVYYNQNGYPALGRSTQ